MSDYQNRSTKKDKKRIILTLILSFILFTYYQNIIAQNSSDEKAKQLKLIRILKKTGEYYNRLEHSAFDFICLLFSIEEVNTK